MKYKKILLALVLVTNKFICLSQVTGKVIDEINFPLEYATAALYNQETNMLVTGVITDINGVFSFENLKKGSYLLRLLLLAMKEKSSRTSQLLIQINQ